MVIDMPQKMFGARPSCECKSLLPYRGCAVIELGLQAVTASQNPGLNVISELPGPSNIVPFLTGHSLLESTAMCTPGAEFLVGIPVIRPKQQLHQEAQVEPLHKCRTCRDSVGGAHRKPRNLSACQWPPEKTPELDKKCLFCIQASADLPGSGLKQYYSKTVVSTFR